MDRAQLPLSLVELAVGLVLLFGVTLGFTLGVAPAETRDIQLDAYAQDGLTLLQESPPRHANATRLNEVLASPSAFDRERAALDRRLDRLLPDNLMYRLRTPYGSIGDPRPNGVAVGRATATTPNGAVTLEVWYV